MTGNQGRERLEVTVWVLLFQKALGWFQKMLAGCIKATQYLQTSMGISNCWEQVHLILS